MTVGYIIALSLAAIGFLSVVCMVGVVSLLIWDSFTSAAGDDREQEMDELERWFAAPAREPVR